jgi:hypothetical protein
MAEPAADIVILSQPDHREVDPKGGEDAPTVPARVVLHRAGPRVLVETQDGLDAVGKPHWLRLDDVDATLGAAYRAVSGVLATWYDRAIAAESRVAAAEDRARKAEAKLRGAPTPPALIAGDPKDVAKRRFGELFNLAISEGTTESERASAAKRLVEHLKKHEHLMPR